MRNKEFNAYRAKKRHSITIKKYTSVQANYPTSNPASKSDKVSTTTADNIRLN